MKQHFYLTLQATYETIEYALCSYEHGVTVIDQRFVSKMQASSLLMQELNELLVSHNLAWKNLKALVVNCGPAPFTTLRALIATVNGISFATKIPLVGVDGLKAFVLENPQDAVTVVVLNAFAGDVYFAINDCGVVVEYGWQNGIALLQSLQSRYSGKRILFKGNGVELLNSSMVEVFGKNATVIQPNQLIVSLQTIAHEIVTLSEKSQCFHLSPLYLKTIEYKPSM